MGHDLDPGPVLVTGASGYLGRHVAAALRARHVQCVTTSRSGRSGDACDLTDEASTHALFERIAPSVVIHCAAIVPQSSAAYDDEESAEMSTRMASSVACHARCPVVLVSSMTVYGSNPRSPVDEDSELLPDSAYARGKQAAEELLFRRGRPGDVALRLPGLFGLPRRGGLLYNAARGFLTRGRFDVDAPETCWAAMTVADAAEYLVKAALTTSTQPAQSVNVGYDGEFSIVRAVEQVAGLCGIEWRNAAAATASFSMKLGRLDSRCGKLPVTFGGRLAEFVDAVRLDLAVEATIRP